MTIKLITFDLDNTLWENDSVIRNAEKVYWDSLLDKVPAIKNHFTSEQIAQKRFDFVQNNPHLLSQISELRKQSLDHLLHAFVSETAERRKIVENVFQRFLKARNQVILFHDAIPTLQQLQTQYILGALTNGNSCLQTIGIDQLFTLFFSAEQLNARKPDPAMFIAAMKSAQVEPEETVHIGDHPVDDIQGAQQLGIQTIWFNPQNKNWRELSDQAPPNAEVRTLAEIPDCIQKNLT